MAMSKLQDGDLAFPGGANSFMNPDLLPPGSFTRGGNIVTRGGIPQVRPGYRCKFVLPRGNCQGGRIFRPRVGSPVIVFAVDGALYISDKPFTTYRRIEGVELSSIAPRLFFEQVEDSVEANLDGSLRLTDKRNLLVVQDGGDTRPVVFDGTTAGHTANIPLGGPMCFVGDRLWVARTTSLFASDLGDPLSFTEALYIAGVAKSFTLPGLITALAKVPSTASDTLIVFTETNSTIFKAGIRQRAAWSQTPDFQKEVFPEIGCVANRSVVPHHGLLWWYSLAGLTSMDSAAQANLSSVLPYKDGEMADSKSRLSSDLSGIACSTYENYMLVSVPYADRYNTHTWVADRSQFLAAEDSTWNSVWTGTRPLEWLSGIIDGENRSLFISADYDGETRLWEAFTPDRRDSGCPITWWLETRACNFRAPEKLKEFRYSDLFLSELSGRVDIAAFWSSAFRGKYKRILTKQINATRGYFRPGQTIRMTDTVFALKKQARNPVRTQDGRELNSQETLPSCGVESPNQDFKDAAFQLLIVGSGVAALRGYLMYAMPPANDDDSGAVEPQETEDNFVRFDGAASEEEEFADALPEFEADIPLFTSTQTVTVSRDGFSEIASGTATSIISQSNADYAARCTATRKASAALERAMPLIVSIGDAANEIE